MISRIAFIAFAASAGFAAQVQPDARAAMDTATAIAVDATVQCAHLPDMDKCYKDKIGAAIASSSTEPDVAALLHGMQRASSKLDKKCLGDAPCTRGFLKDMCGWLGLGDCGGAASWLEEQLDIQDAGFADALQGVLDAMVDTAAATVEDCLDEDGCAGLLLNACKKNSVCKSFL